MSTDLFLYRTIQTSQHTLGVLVFKEMQFFTLELPWRENKKSQSCIPADTYNLFVDISRKNGLDIHKYQIIELEPKNKRSQIQFHVGNSANDTAGCILLGKKINNKSVGVKLHCSKDAYLEFFREVYGHVFRKESKLHVVDLF